MKAEYAWTEKTTAPVKRIKIKIQNLPTLSLPDQDLIFVLERDASNQTWATLLLHKHSKREEACAYTSDSFDETSIKYPTSHKEILAVKKGIHRFILFLKSVKFLVRTNLKHMKGILSNKILLEQGNVRVLRSI